MAIDSEIDEINSSKQEPDWSRIPFIGEKDFDTNILRENVNDDIYGVPLQEGSFFGYDVDGNLAVVVNGPGPTNQDYDRFAQEVSNELNLEVSAYLDLGNLSHHSDSMGGVELYNLASNLLDEEPDLVLAEEENYVRARSAEDYFDF